jgi:hypothetical protein
MSDIFEHSSISSLLPEFNALSTLGGILPPLLGVPKILDDFMLEIVSYLFPLILPITVATILRRSFVPREEDSEERKSFLC